MRTPNYDFRRLWHLFFQYFFGKKREGGLKRAVRAEGGGTPDKQNPDRAGFFSKGEFGASETEGIAHVPEPDVGMTDPLDCFHPGEEKTDCGKGEKNMDPGAFLHKKLPFSPVYPGCFAR